MAAVLDQLGQVTVPQIFANLQAAGFLDTMEVLAPNLAQSDGGGMITSGWTSDYSAVPVIYKPISTPSRLAAGETNISNQQYLLTFPTHKDDSRINIDPTVHVLKVNARGNEPEKTFRIISGPDVFGIIYKAYCDREN